MAHAEDVVRELMARVITERGLTGPLEIRALSSGGANYTSALFAASVDNFKAFAKVATIAEKMRSVMNAEMLFKTEQIVYNNLAKIYNELLAKHEAAAPFQFPKVYATLSDLGRESVVMEDLTAQGYRSPVRYDSIDWHFASAAVRKLAAFHALSFAYEKERPEEFAAMAEMLKYRSLKTPETEAATKAAFQGIIKGAIEVVKEEHRPSLIKLLTDEVGFIKFKSPISRTVLVHGDFRASNIMFKEQDGSIDVIVVDYQTVHSGSPVSDLLYLILLGSDQHFRRNHYQDLLDLYHAELSTALDGLGVDVQEVYSKEVFDKEVEEMLPPALQMTAVILPIVMVDMESAPQMSSETADLTNFAIAPSEMFANRFAAIVEDYVEWGVI